MTSKLAILCSFVALTYSVIQVHCINGGENAKPGQHPYYVGLFFNYSATNFPMLVCGGVILNDQWILTAARCADRLDVLENKFFAKAGSIYYTGESETEQLSDIVESYLPVDKPPPVEYSEEEEEYYEEYGFQPKIKHHIFDDVVGLLKLANPLVFNEFVSPIDLPEDHVIPKGEGTVVGLGVSDPRPTNITEVLQTVKLPIMEYNECADYVAKHDLESSVVLTDSKFCTAPTKQNQAHCGADRGGPLISEVQGKSVLVGIATREGYIDECATPGKPSVYIQVSAFTEWIRKTIKTH